MKKSMPSDELDDIHDRYARRALKSGLYSPFHSDVIYLKQEKQRSLLHLLKKNHISNLIGTSILEIGCGSGSNLLELMLLGANPELLAANELLPDRIEQARRMLPASVRIYPGNAADLPFENESFDIFMYE